MKRLITYNLILCFLYVFLSSPRSTIHGADICERSTGPFENCTDNVSKNGSIYTRYFLLVLMYVWVLHLRLTVYMCELVCFGPEMNFLPYTG